MTRSITLAVLLAVPFARAQESLPESFGSPLSGGAVFPGKDEYRVRPITVECRAKLNNANSFNILVASDPKSSSEHWSLYSVVETGVFSVYQPGRGNEFTSATNICDGQWHHLAAYLGQDVVKLYVDGVQVLELPASRTDDPPDPGSLGIGRLAEGGLRCDGLVDDVHISSGERKIVVDDKPVKADGTTIDIWSFDD